jgi:hypothetical protein
VQASWSWVARDQRHGHPVAIVTTLDPKALARNTRCDGAKFSEGGHSSDTRVRVGNSAVIHLIIVALAQASSVLVGTLRTVDSLPVVGARVSLPAFGVVVQSDSSGNFRLSAPTRGVHQILIAKLGFDSIAVQQRFDVDVFTKDYVLSRSAQLLAGARITAREEQRTNDVLSAIERRRAGGVGRFLTAKDIAQHAGRPTADILASIPGFTLFRPNSHAACVGVSRGSRTLSAQPATCDGVDVTMDCPIIVFLDGSKVYSGGRSEPLFNVNSIPSRTIAAIEAYSSGGAVPAEFSSALQGCGALVFWTKR